MPNHYLPSPEAERARPRSPIPIFGQIRILKTHAGQNYLHLLMDLITLVKI